MKIFFLPALLLALISCSHKLSPDHTWSNKQWVLTEVKGVPVQLSGTNKDAHLAFDVEEKTYSGSGGCNRISGSYKLGKKDAISFGEPATTKMMCPDLAFENLVISTLKTVDRHTEAGNIMLLKKGDEIVLKLQAK